MKKRSVSGNETSSRQLHRRQTRPKANSIQTHNEDEKETSQLQSKRRKVRLGLTNLSPIHDQSPESCSKRQDISKRDSKFETPKSNKSGYLHDSTPFKDDILLASQGYDAQCDVRWDCTSPDALRYIRKNRRRHHSSDVADIVQLLIPKESQEEDAGSSTNTPPLLGLWMNLSNQSTHASKDDKSGHSTHPVHSSKLVRFRKKDKLRSRDAKMPRELLEKLKLAVEKCDGQSTTSTEEVAESDKDTKKDESPEGFDKSKDLFASAEAARSVLIERMLHLL
ncbi:uncharacterized protein LOC117323022 isoform X2 [Pecten maximus]|uniref:uncharacterized protein LOC117323022 isoform X2 n=1 Tax=Pecten maximus TaxID=6579 RepID=UPI001458AC38|nr:uncharacterized protein LOC117323022 isoform X2 [Pecten maximus]